MTEQQGTRLTPVGKILSFLLILALIGIGGYVVYQRMNPPTPQNSANAGPHTESMDPRNAEPITTVKQYTYVAGDRLPAVKGASAYQWDNTKKTLRFSYNVWSGWLPVIAANHGTKANDESIFYKKYGFRVEMVLMDSPVQARDAFIAGDVHTLWGTADMMVLFAGGLARDSRTAARIVQQIDWSNGGDGIVVRNRIKNVADLRGKTIVLAKNSPSEYYLTSLLLSAGLKPTDIKAKYTDTAFEAAAAFVADKSVDGCVSWSPDIYKIPEADKTVRILSSTSDANKLIADVYAVRADFARDHPEIVEGLVAGIFEGMDMVKASPAEPCKWMADAFGMKPEDVMGMRNDAHPTNFAENTQFFLNASNPTNFERTWKNAVYVYRELGTIEPKDIVPFDQVMDFSVVQKLEKAGQFKEQKDESVATFTPGAVRTMTAEKILTQTIRINFYPNSANPYEPGRDMDGLVIAGKLYDPNVDATLERVARLVGQFGRANVLIEGHADSSMKGKAPVAAVKELSQQRAEAIKRALVEKYKFDPNKFTVEGKGWDVPANPEEPLNQALNRRVEISVYPPEQGN
ncbi:MAG: phosphate ABC transporter substrate-binding/OmpA family protein [Phycisphaerae bacterium]